jgi:peptidoglycan-N-acetylglucosamine deacetylase
MKSEFACWPNGNKIAVAVTVMFETWPEGKGPPNLVQRTQVKPGTIDHQAITWPQYGGKAGVWRIIRILDQCGVPGTFCTNARCAEVYPEAVAQIVRSGHDIAAHGYTQDLLLAHAKTPEEEHELIRRSLDVLERSTGKRPEGWLSPVLAWTEHTADFLAQEKVLWQGDANYIDLPRRVTTNYGTIVHIPHSDYTDNRVVWLSPRQYHDVYQDTFDYLYAHEPMSLLVLTVHCHFGGRPLMSAVLDKLLRYFSRFPGVWFARHRELAQWAMKGPCEEVTYAQRFFSA